MSTQVEYNGILMDAVKTRTWKREVMRTADRTDRLSARYTFEFDLMLARSANSYNQSAVAQSGFAPRQSWDNIKEKLLQRRKTLKIWIGGGMTNLVFQCPEDNVFTDAAHGPHPLYARATRIDADGAMILSFGIETFKFEMDSGLSSPLVSNRWQMIHDLDGDYLTVLQWRGQAVFGTDLLRNGASGHFSADSFRYKFWPPVPYGFKRERANLELSSDNRIITYHMVDREQVMPLGARSKATRLTGTYSTFSDLSNASTGQPVFGAHLHIMASGPKNVSREELLTQAVRLAMTKIEKSRQPNLIQLYMSRVTYSWESRQVQLEMAVKLAPPATAAHAFLPDWRLSALADDKDVQDGLSWYGGGFPGQSIMPPPPGDNGTRGTFLRALQAQVVRSDDSVAVLLPPQL